METFLKTGFGQISIAPKKSGLPKIWGGGRGAARTPMSEVLTFWHTKTCDKFVQTGGGGFSNPPTSKIVITPTPKEP